MPTHSEKNNFSNPYLPEADPAAAWDNADAGETFNGETLNWRKGAHTPSPGGTILPETPYTGMVVHYRNPDTGHIRTEWAGELHGSWETSHDPASEMLANARASHDGYLPYRAVFSSPSPYLAGGSRQYNLILLHGEQQLIAARLSRMASR